MSLALTTAGSGSERRCFRGSGTGWIGDGEICPSASPRFLRAMVASDRSCPCIGRDPTPECYHCGPGMDSPQHTLEFCPSWGVPRGELVRVIGWNLSMPVIIESMLVSQESWVAVSTFCDVVMAAKEEAERERRGEGSRHRANRGPRRPGRVPRPYRPRLAHIRDG